MSEYMPQYKVLTPSDNTLVYVLDGSYTTIAVIDMYESLIWTERYLEAGDFELYVPLTMKDLDKITIGSYLAIEDSDRLMIVEKFQQETDVEDGDKMTITGRTLESILDRRVIWNYTVLNGEFQNGIKRLIDENVISPAESGRQIPGFSFATSSDSAITSKTLDTQYLGENLYDSIVELCTEKDIGWKVLPNGAGGFQFSLYPGVNYAYDQSARPYVVFSPGYDNLIGSKYVYSLGDYKTVARVGGEGDGYDKRLGSAAVSAGEGSGLSRREMYVNSGVSGKDEDGEELSESEYQAALTQKGLEALADTDIDEAFEAEIDASRQFIYDEHFSLGDIVQVEDKIGLSRKVRISEIMRSWDTNGLTMTPTFTTLEETE